MKAFEVSHKNLFSWRHRAKLRGTAETWGCSGPSVLSGMARVSSLYYRRINWYQKFNPILVQFKFLSNQGNFSNNSNIPVDKLYNHFQQLHSVPDMDSLSYTQENIVENLKDKVTQSIQFNNLDQPFTEDEIRASVKSLKNKKSPVPDWIRSEMLKCSFHHLSTSLTNYSISYSAMEPFLVHWTHPIFKSGNKSDPSNYRGICVTSCLGKLFAVLLNARSYNFLKWENLLHPPQIGFLKGFRTTDHIFSLRTLIEKYQSLIETKVNHFVIL